MQRLVKKSYYSTAFFREGDKALQKVYRYKNPYRICKSGPYGETPLPTLHRILHFAKLKPEETYVELGSGRGRGALFASRVLGAKVTAIEENSLFIECAKKLMPEVTLLQRNYLTEKLPQADLYYLYGTSLSDEEVHKIKTLFPKNATVITISYPLGNPFKTIGTLLVTFPWGDTLAYVQINH